MRRSLVVVCALLVLAPAADAKKFFGGVVPDVVAGSHAPAAAPLARIANLPYGGGQVLHSNRTHAIFWAPSGSGLTFDAGYTALIDTFLRDVAADSHRESNPYSLSGQYRDSGGPAAYASRFAGAVVDTDPLPASACVEPIGAAPAWLHCLDDQQLEDEINHVVRTRHLPSTHRDVYFLITPAGLGSCEFTGPEDCALGGATSGSYCGYHSSTPDGLPYAVIPYNAVPGHCQSTNPRPNGSTADPTISTISHEHNEIVTDPFGDAWIDASFAEDGDLCITNFGPALGGGGGSGAWDAVIHRHRYWIQEEWSNANGGCAARARPDHVAFKPPRHPRAGVSVRFIASGHAPQARVSGYEWFWGDDKIGHGRRSHHIFRRAASYRVVVRLTDRWGNWAFSARRVRVGRR